jgi:flagellar motor switch protein FliG
MPLTGREKATIFLSMLGAETSARVLRYLPDELADLIAAGINHLPTPSPQALEQVLGEFKSYLALPQAKTAAPQVEEKPKPPAPKKLYSILMYERPQMIAYLLSLMPEEQREDALHSLPREKSIVEELLSDLKKNPLSPKLEAKLKEQFSGKLFIEEA